MDIVSNQRRILQLLLERLRPRWRTEAALPAQIEHWLRRERNWGSRDRRFYRELLYTALRYLPWIEPLFDAADERLHPTLAWLAADTPATQDFRASLLAGWPPCPPGIAAKAAVLGADPDAILPAWFRAECPESFAPAQRDAFATRSPLWLRLQTDDPAPVYAEFAARGWSWRPSGLLPGAIAMATEVDLTTTAAYREGLIEVQDVGSQLILATAGISAGGRWLDACAGAGGKSLQLARLLGPTGRVEASDIRPAALEELVKRAQRAGLADRIVRCEVPTGTYAGVLVDAPCSGSGTWRRSPHLKWVTTPGEVRACAERQSALLAHFASWVALGGSLIYATCSLCRSENEDVVRGFLAARPEFAPAAAARPLSGERRGDGLIFWPAAHDGDGFFAAALVRRP